jgi:hypothetical protein
MIPSLWLPIASVLTELLSHASKLMITKAGDRVFDPRIVKPKPLLDLRAHFAALKDATDALYRETHSGKLSDCYHRLRSAWLDAFAPAQTVLHNFDPATLSALDIFSRKYGLLLAQELKVTERTLTDALAAEQTEIDYDTESHLCTLCLQIVRNWSDSKTIAGGLNELSEALQDTVAQLDMFISSTWKVTELQ